MPFSGQNGAENLSERRPGDGYAGSFSENAILKGRQLFGISFFFTSSEPLCYIG